MCRSALCSSLHQVMSVLAAAAAAAFFSAQAVVTLWMASARRPTFLVFTPAMLHWEGGQRAEGADDGGRKGASAGRLVVAACARLENSASQSLRPSKAHLMRPLRVRYTWCSAVSLSTC